MPTLNNVLNFRSTQRTSGILPTNSGILPTGINRNNPRNRGTSTTPTVTTPVATPGVTASPVYTPQQITNFGGVQPNLVKGMETASMKDFGGYNLPTWQNPYTNASGGGMQDVVDWSSVTGNLNDVYQSGWNPVTQQWAQGNRGVSNVATNAQWGYDPYGVSKPATSPPGTQQVGSTAPSLNLLPAGAGDVANRGGQASQINMGGASTPITDTTGASTPITDTTGASTPITDTTGARGDVTDRFSQLKQTGLADVLARGGGGTTVLPATPPAVPTNSNVPQVPPPTMGADNPAYTSGTRWEGGLPDLRVQTNPEDVQLSPAYQFQKKMLDRNLNDWLLSKGRANSSFGAEQFATQDERLLSDEYNRQEAENFDRSMAINKELYTRRLTEEGIDYDRAKYMTELAFQAAYPQLSTSYGQSMSDILMNAALQQAMLSSASGANTAGMTNSLSGISSDALNSYIMSQLLKQK